MAMKPQNTGGDPVPDMNTTPLIDVMLVLLTMLIITLPIQTHAVKLDLQASEGPPPPPPIVVSLTVEFDGTMLWDGNQIDRKTLDADLTDAAHRNPQPEIHIEADSLARYDAVAKILADAQRLGVTKIGIVGTDKYLRQ
jgi:biopolymer transport protein ExbD